MHTRPRRAAGALAAAVSLLLGAAGVDAAAVAPATAAPAPARQQPPHWDKSGLTATLAADAGEGATIGYSSALSGDGSTAVLGAPDANGYDGAVYVFHRVGAAWRQAAVLTQSDVQYGELGFAVAVSDDGRTIVAGTASTSERVYVFTQPRTTWSRTAELTAPPGGGAVSLFGSSVAVSGDGSTVAAGAFARDTDRGAAFVYTGAEGQWSGATEVVASDGAAGDYFGYHGSVSLSHDGKTLAVGAPGKDQQKGGVYTFARQAGTWTQTAELTAADGAAADRFGQAVALSGTGDTIAVGAPYHGTGLAYAFTRTGRSWTQTAELRPGGKNDYPSDAISVGISGDGSVVGVGLPSRNGLGGAAAVFVRHSGGYRQKATLVPSEFQGRTNGAGTSMAISADGHTALAGAPGIADPTFPAGGGFVYQDGAAQPGPGVAVGVPSATASSKARSAVAVPKPPAGVTPAVAAPAAASSASSATSPMHVSKLAGRHPVLGSEHRTATACTAAPRPGYASCDAQVVTDSALKPLAAAGYEDGYTPSQLQSAYGLSGLTGKTLVAVVDAFANPNAQASLNTYRNTFGLGPVHLTQVGQDGDAGLPAADSGWGTEEMLDLEMVSAACPTCSILYVGADSASFDDLGAAVNTAVRMGAKVVSNSYGGTESADDGQLQAKYYQHPGVAITASSGDSGYGVSAPASFGSVVAVGGTSLTLNAAGKRTDETAWGDAGSGCSRFSGKPKWQHDGYCAHRTVADVSAVADPDTGVAVYDAGGGGWLVVGGTSVSAPLIAGIYGLTGHTSGRPAQRLYSAPRSSLYDVTSGSSGTCSSAYLCAGRPGYDGPTGLGSPHGTRAF